MSSNITSPARKLCTRPRRIPMAEQTAQVWVYYRDAIGVFAAREIDVTQLTPEQQAEYDQFIASLPEDPFERDYPIEEPVRFPTLRLAMRYAQLEDEEYCVASDMDAFHAPGECAEIAYSSLNARRESLLQWALQ